MTASEEAAKRLEEAMKSGVAPKETAKVKIFTRVTLRIFEGDDTSGEPIQTIVKEEPGFREAHEAGQKGVKDATD